MCCSNNRALFLFCLWTGSHYDWSRAHIVPAFATKELELKLAPPHLAQIIFMYMSFTLIYLFACLVEFGGIFLFFEKGPHTVPVAVLLLFRPV